MSRCCSRWPKCNCSYYGSRCCSSWPQCHCNVSGIQPYYVETCEDSCKKSGEYQQGISGIQQLLGVYDTTSISLNINNIIPQTLAAHVNISEEDGNILILESDGLFVPSDVVEISALDESIVVVGGDEVGVQISGDVGNILTLEADGLFVPPTSAAVTALDDSIVVVGGDEIGVQISADVGNVLSLQPDGLFVPPGVTTVTALDDSIVVIGGDEIGVQISVDANNGLSLHADGLFAIEGGTEVFAADASIEVTGGDTIGVQISADVGNALSLEPDGLFVTPGATEVFAADDSIVVTSDVNIAVQISADVGNTLTLEPDGLFAAGGGIAAVLPGDASIDVTGGDTVSVAISADGGNALSLQPDGLFATAGGGSNNTLNTSVAQSGNTAGGGDTDAYSYTMPGGTLADDKDSIEITASGSLAASGTQRIRVLFGATTILDTGSGGFGGGAVRYWTFKCQVYRTGAATQKGNGYYVSSSSGMGTGWAGAATPGETLSGNVVVKLVINGTSANDVSAETWKVVKVPKEP